MLSIRYSIVEDFLTELNMIYRNGEAIGPLRISQTFRPSSGGIGNLYRRSVSAGVPVRYGSRANGDDTDALVVLDFDCGDWMAGEPDATAAWNDEGDTKSSAATDAIVRAAATFGMDVRAGGRYTTKPD